MLASVFESLLFERQAQEWHANRSARLSRGDFSQLLVKNPKSYSAPRYVK
jgi:hypothetical protein